MCDAIKVIESDPSLNIFYQPEGFECLYHK